MLDSAAAAEKSIQENGRHGRGTPPPAGLALLEPPGALLAARFEEGGKELRRHIGRAALMRFVDLTHVYREPIVRRVERGRLRVLRRASDRAFSGNAYP